MARIGFNFYLLFFVCFIPALLSAEELLVTSNPFGATVEIDGRIVGRTPYVAKLPGGYFHKTMTVFQARLEHPLHMRISKDGYISKDIELTEGPMRWIALNGVDHGNYYLLKDKQFSVTLNPEAKEFTAPLAKPSASPQMELTSAELSIESIVDQTSSAVLKLSTAEGSGSGFLVTSGGVVVTNAHVVGDNNEVTAKNVQRQQFNGKVVYKDTALDLALVKLDVDGTPSLTMTNLASARVGQSVVAIGNPGLGMQNTVTRGIISAVGAYPELGPGTWIQTDASINPGNSGGPLLNSHGQVIGMNTIKIVKADVQGIGFALSAQDILEAVQRFFPVQIPNTAGKGKIQIASTVSDAEVYIDGKFVGDAPSSVPLSAGDHVIEVKASKFADWKRTITVTDGSDQNVKASLQPQ